MGGGREYGGKSMRYTRRHLQIEHHTGTVVLLGLALALLLMLISARASGFPL
jgi:hypothetical protein